MQEWEQLGFEVLEPTAPKIAKRRLNVGDKVSRVVLGECRIATISEVEGNEQFFFYRTIEHGCYSAEEGEQDISENKRIAEENRKKYYTIEPRDLTERITVKYAPRKCDGHVLWAQIGFFGDMLYWKKDMTYEFCETFDSVKKRQKAYDKHKAEILQGDYTIVDDEIPMERLYLFHDGLYTMPEYSAIKPVIKGDD